MSDMAETLFSVTRVAFRVDRRNEDMWNCSGMLAGTLDAV